MSAYQLYLGDCLEFMRGMDAGSVDAVIADFPYGIDYPYRTYNDTRENLIKLINSAVPEMRRIAKRVAIFCGVNNLQLYAVADWTIAWYWKGTNTYGMYGINQWQPIVLYGKDVSGFGSVNGVLKSDAIYYEGGNCDELKHFDDHPCPKNVGIMRRLIARITSDYDTVLDVTMGSGTTGVACMQLGRNFIGCEIDPNYYAIAERRIRDAAAQLPLPEMHAPKIEAIQEAML